MAEPEYHGGEAAFPHGGGATEDLIATHDWAVTPLGPVDAWPQSLKTTTAMLLRSPLPMVLQWGADGFLIYNDAYSRLVGGRHHLALGAPPQALCHEFAEMAHEILEAALAGRTMSLSDCEFTVLRSGQRERAWFNIDSSPVMDETGRPAGALTICVETTQRILAERRAALDTERRRRIFEQAPGFICLLSGPEFTIEFTNEAHDRLFDIHDAVGRPYHEVFSEVADRGGLELLRQVYATGERYVGRAESTFITKAGERRQYFLDVVLAPLTDEQGRITGIIAEGFDVTEQVRAQAAALESERRLSAAVAIARLGAFEWNLETGEATLDCRAREIFGFEPDRPISLSEVIGRIDPDDFLRARALTNSAGRSRNEFEYRVRLPDGSTRNIASVSDMILGPDGRRLRVVGIVDDVTDRRRAENRQRMLINELNHRVKNTLATVQSIASQTLRSAHDLPSAGDSFESRLIALAAAHDILTAQSWHGARLSDVVAAALAPFESALRPQISRSGPPAWLAAQPALALTLALHELATNATKYGALSVPEGEVRVSWRLDGDEVALSWREHGGPVVKAPSRSGFGSRLLQRGLARELQGEVAVAFARKGVRCDIRFQLAPTAEPLPVG